MTRRPSEPADAPAGQPGKGKGTPPEGCDVRLVPAGDTVTLGLTFDLEDLRILDRLRAAHPFRVATARVCPRDRSVARRRLGRLERAGFISRPEGQRSGYALTPRGIALQAFLAERSPLHRH